MVNFGTKKRRENGFTLIELVIVIAVIGIGIAVIVARGNSTKAQGKVGTAVEQLQQLAAGIENVYGTSTSYSGLTNAVLLAGSSVPDTMRGPSAGQISHPWNSSGVTIGTALSNSKWTITYASVPAEICTDLASRTYRAYESLTVNGTAITNPGVAATNCSGASNSLVWTGG